MKIRAGQSCEVVEGLDKVQPPAENEMCWIDIEAFADADLETLRQRFGFHPLAIEDCIRGDQRPKLDEYGDHVFAALHALKSPKPSALEVEELYGFLGVRYLVTVHRRPVEVISSAWQRCASDAATAACGCDFLFYLVVDALVDGAFPIIDRLSDTMESLEDSVLKKVNEHQLGQILGLKRTMVSIRRELSPMRDLIAVLTRRGDPRISEKTSLYFRDVYDHIARAHEQIDVERDMLGNTLDAYLSMIANRTNNIMKRLTIIAAIFLPLGFMTGFFGQNFEAMPYASTGVFAFEMAACVLVPVGMVYWFYRSGWF